MYQCPKFVISTLSPNVFKVYINISLFVKKNKKYFHQNLETKS